MKTWQELSQITNPFEVMDQADRRQSAILALVTSLDIITIAILLKVDITNLPDDKNDTLFYLAPYMEANFIELSDDDLRLLAFRCGIAAMATKVMGL